MKAKFIKAIYDTNPFNKHSWEHVELVYEYKGHQYIVTKHNNGYEFDSLYYQHKDAQKHIDEMIAKENEPIKEYTGECEKALNELFNYLEGK